MNENIKQRDKVMNKKINFAEITACGECCSDCKKRMNGLCMGCIEADGYVPEWESSGRCKMHDCARKHNVQFCGICDEFPCKDLTSLIHWNPDIVEHLSKLAGQYHEQEQKSAFINQSKAVWEQYKTTDNLNTRISIHAKYSANKQGFGNWLFSNYDIPRGSRILELGCGTGDMWISKLKELEKSVELTLTDFSENMVSAAKDNLGKPDNVFYDVVNIENIPYTDSRFDRVIANMMLYHVPNLDRGLSEVKRVLKHDGHFYCATYGENGIMPFIAGLFSDYGVTDTTNKIFTLQSGYGILKKYFSDVERLDYEDFLAVTDIEDLLDYIWSLNDMSPIAGLGRNTVKEILEKEMVNGVLKIPKEYGMFICKK